MRQRRNITGVPAAGKSCWFQSQTMGTRTGRRRGDGTFPSGIIPLALLLFVGPGMDTRVLTGQMFLSVLLLSR